MFEIVLCVVGLGFMILFYMLVKVLISDDEQTMKDFHFCYGCQAGWCTFVPGSKECREWKKEHGNDGSIRKRSEGGDDE